MAPPTNIVNNSSPSLGPYRLALDIGPSWLIPQSSLDESTTLLGVQTGLRLGSAYSISENVNFHVNGVFSYARYFGDNGDVSRIGLGMEMGPEFRILPELSLGLFAGVQAGFYHSEGLDWPSVSGRASFSNEMATAFILRPNVSLFDGILNLSYLYGHDFGVGVPGPTAFDAPEAFSVDHHSVMATLDAARLFYSRRGGFRGETDSFEQFLLGIKIITHIEGSYTYSLNEPRGEDGQPGVNPYRTNTPHHDRFRFNLIEFALERPSTLRSPLGFRADLIFGEDPVSFAPASSLLESVSGADEEAGTQYFAAQQIYLTYMLDVMQGLTIKAGQFGTTVGNEYPEGSLNPFLNISRGYLNTLAEPFFHAGALGTLRFTQENNANDETTAFSEATIGVVNGWDSVLGHEGGPTVVLGFTHMVDPDLTYAVNYLIGPEGQGAQGLFNANALWKVNSRWSLGTNINLGHGNNDEGESTLWFGAGLYQQYSPVSWFNLVAREEFFTDPDGARTDLSQSLISGTLGANFLISGGSAIPGLFGIGPEIRHDHSLGREAGAPGPFLEGDQASDGNTTFSLRAFWRFPRQL